MTHLQQVLALSILRQGIYALVPALRQQEKANTLHASLLQFHANLFPPGMLENSPRRETSLYLIILVQWVGNPTKSHHQCSSTYPRRSNHIFSSAFAPMFMQMASPSPLGSHSWNKGPLWRLILMLWSSRIISNLSKSVGIFSSFRSIKIHLAGKLSNYCLSGFRIKFQRRLSGFHILFQQRHSLNASCWSERHPR
jgi:hypothetical protein